MNRPGSSEPLRRVDPARSNAPGRQWLLAVGVLSAAVLLAGCDQDDPAPACKVDVDTPELRDFKAEIGMADCDPGEAKGGTDLPDVELSCLGGGTAGALADVEGPAVINFWSSNCGPCRKEMPALERFHRRYGDQVPVIGVDFLDTQPGEALELARRAGSTYPSYVDACGDLQETDLAVTALPVFAFVKADGSVEMAAGGVDSVPELVDLVDEHLGLDLAAKDRR